MYIFVCLKGRKSVPLYFVKRGTYRSSKDLHIMRRFLSSLGAVKTTFGMLRVYMNILNATTIEVLKQVFIHFCGGARC